MSAFREKEHAHPLLGNFLLIPVLTGVLATAVLGAGLMRRGSRDSVAFRYWSADRAATVAAERWVISAESDSLKTWVSLMRTSPDTLVVRVDAGVPQAIALVADSMLRAEWRAVAPHARDARVFAVLALDTARDAGALKRPRERLPRYVMPWRLDARSCVAVIHVTRDVAANPEMLKSGAMSTGMSPVSLGPCAFIGALGLPGVGARKWLDIAGSTHAMRIDWWRAPAPAPPVSALATDVTQREASALESKRYQDRVGEAVRSPRVASCREGNASRCVAVVYPGSPQIDEGGYVMSPDERLTAPAGVLMPVTGLSRESIYGALLSDLVRDHGRETVGTAWRGNEPFMDAVARAAGTTPASLGGQWVRRTLPAMTHADVLLNPAAIAVPVLMSCVLLVLALVTARGRERS